MLCRCLRGHSWPAGRNGRKYVGYAIPIGYPQTSAICGLCNDPAVVWFDEKEISSYEQGNRIFEGPNKFVKIKVDDSGVTTKDRSREI